MRFIVPIVVVLMIVGVLVAVVYGIGRRGETVAQPIAFNHALHLDARMECLDCHTDAKTRVYAGLPGKDICLDCHEVDVIEEEASSPGVSPELAKLIPFADSDQDIPWKRIALTAPDVFFSHRRHVTAGGIDCIHCHSDQPVLTAPPPTAESVMTMDDCINCHKENKTSIDCLACHR